MESALEGSRVTELAFADLSVAVFRRRDFDSLEEDWDEERNMQMPRE